MNNLDELIKIFCDITDKHLMEKFFDEIFTPAEKNTFALRWALMKSLYAKLPQREIASKLGISLCKITRGSKILKKENSVLKNILKNYTEE